MKTEDLEARIAKLEKELVEARDIQEIERLQHAYGFYLEKWMHDECLECFSKNPEASVNWPEGSWIGQESLKRYWRGVNKDDNPEFMHQMMQISGVITLAPDGKTAKGRWYGFGAAALPVGDKMRQGFGCGIYENEYVKEDGRWKIFKMKWVADYVAPQEVGWVKPERLAPPGAKGSGGLGTPLRPDKGPPDENTIYPSGYIFPFHYKHPVTGKKTTEDGRNAALKDKQEPV
jgi:hypothetical protein